jgi:hypothetical protein
LPALAHTTAVAPWSVTRLATSSVPRPLKLRTGFAVSSLMLTVQAELASQCVTPEQRRGQKDRVDDIAGRADPVKIESGLEHSRSIYPTIESSQSYHCRRRSLDVRLSANRKPTNGRIAYGSALSWPRSGRHLTSTDYSS